MTTVLLIIHLFVTLALIGVVLIQRSEGGGLGIGTAQGMGSFMSGRGTANLLTRATAILATIFMALSLTLALMNRGTSGVGSSILDVPSTTPAPASSGTPAPGAGPSGTPTPGTPAPGTPSGAPASGAPASGAPASGAPSSGPAKPGPGAATPGAPAAGSSPAPQQGTSVPTN
ncbi:MAG: preprotein translocase subunit SecG [Rhodospirillales bacterium]|nr:preprotein translocase subunit SecG [Rhodospirillales bacterium]